jgi:hypothetical protein
MGFFTGSTKTKWKEPGYSIEARNYITDLYKGGTPDIPLQRIAEMSPQEQAAMSILTRYLGSESEPRKLATELATKTATTPVDITQIPEYKGLLDTVLEEGRLEANRLGRTLQQTGGAESTPGRDILARSVDATTAKALGALAPYAADERNKRFNAISLLNMLAGDTEAAEINKIKTGVDAGRLPRSINQAAGDAQFQQQMTETMFPYNVLAALARANIVSPMPVTTESPSTMSKISSLVTLGSQVAGGIKGIGSLSGGNTGTGLYSQPTYRTPGRVTGAAQNWLYS